MTKQELFHKIEIQEQLPTLPSVVTKVLNLISNPKVSAKKIGEVISTDISLSSKTLKIVNSAFYGFPKRVSTITQAVVILGFNAIKSAVFGVAVINAFNKYSKNPIIDYNEFWKHSVAVGSASRVIAKHAGCDMTEEVFIGGVIHDIGKLILSQFSANTYQKVIEKAREKDDKYSYSEIERQFINYDHSEIGHYLVEKWNFPENLASIIRYHHNPLKAPENEEKELIFIVSVANILINILKIGNTGNYFIEKIPIQVWKSLNLNINELPDLYDEIKNEYDNASLFLY
jgi:putative nucleotidyltransferase with HDIG domain